jgi:hypothetical protein
MQVVAGLIDKRKDKVDNDLQQGKIYLHFEVIVYTCSDNCPIGNRYKNWRN